MNRSVIFKIIALANFVVLFTIFLLYRNGSFDNYLYKDTVQNFTSPNGGVGAKHIADSIKAAYDSLRALETLRMASSKSIVVSDRRYNPRDIPRKDSTAVNPTDNEKEMMKHSKREMMYSSKSGMIVKPRIFMLDSLLKEKEKQKKQQ